VEHLEFELPHWKENLYILFGTMNVIEIMMPISKELPLNGLEWTYMNF
jgi:hypothetical protein